jgi:hypothetical protein
VKITERDGVTIITPADNAAERCARLQFIEEQRSLARYRALRQLQMPHKAYPIWRPWRRVLRRVRAPVCVQEIDREVRTSRRRIGWGHWSHE